MVVPYTFGGAGKYKVTMTMTDAVFKKKYSVTRTIHVKGPRVDDSDVEQSNSDRKGGAQ